MATPEYLGGNEPQAADEKLPLLHRIAGGLFDLLPEDAEMSDLFPEGNEPLPGDDELILLKKAASSVHILAESGLGGGGGAGGFSTGDVKQSFASSAPEGWLLCDGKFIGSASAGAANIMGPEYEALFLFLWNNLLDDEAHVNEGRGDNAAADWAENKAIKLPDARARFLLSTDLPGETGSGRITNAVSAIDPVLLGASGGQQSRTLIEGNLPAHSHEVGETSIQQGTEGGATVLYPGSGSATGLTGEGEEFSTLPPCITVNTFIKL